jgi:hypothetical protein
MKQIGWIALLMAVNLCGCAVGKGVAPPYNIAVSKQAKQLPPNEWCSVAFTLSNNRSFNVNPWIEARVLDADNKVVDERFFTFAVPRGQTDTEEQIIYAACDRIRQIAITGNREIVKPDIFAWKER